MTALSNILAEAKPTDGGFTAHIPTDWLQGRTAYGGLSSALALHAATLLYPSHSPTESIMHAHVAVQPTTACAKLLGF